MCYDGSPQQKPKRSTQPTAQVNLCSTPRLHISCISAHLQDSDLSLYCALEMQGLKKNNGTQKLPKKRSVTKSQEKYKNGVDRSKKLKTKQQEQEMAKGKSPGGFELHWLLNLINLRNVLHLSVVSLL